MPGLLRAQPGCHGKLLNFAKYSRISGQDKGEKELVTAAFPAAQLRKNPLSLPTRKPFHSRKLLKIVVAALAGAPDGGIV